MPEAFLLESLKSNMESLSFFLAGYPVLFLTSTPQCSWCLRGSARPSGRGSWTLARLAVPHAR